MSARHWLQATGYRLQAERILGRRPATGYWLPTEKMLRVRGGPRATGNGLRPEKMLFVLVALLSLTCGVAWAQQAPVEATAARASGPRFDVDVDEAPARAFFLGLVDGTPHNMLVDPQVSGRISIRLKQVTVEETLDA